MKRIVKGMVRRLFKGSASEVPVDVRHPARPHPKRVWRITEGAPQGEWMEPDEAATAVAQRLSPYDSPHDSSKSWNASSLDLLHGADVVEFSQDTMPSAFYGDKPEPADPKPPKKRS